LGLSERAGCGLGPGVDLVGGLAEDDAGLGDLLGEVRGGDDGVLADLDGERAGCGSDGGEGDAGLLGEVPELGTEAAELLLGVAQPLLELVRDRGAGEDQGA